MDTHGTSSGKWANLLQVLMAEAVATWVAAGCRGISAMRLMASRIGVTS